MTDTEFSVLQSYVNGVANIVYDGETALPTLSVENPRLWTADTPNLYTIVIEAGGEYIRKQIGFRSIAVSAKGELLINGTPVKLKGVNRHDTHPTKGYTVSLEDMTGFCMR